MKLNPAKSIFGSLAGKFIGFVITQTKNEVCPSQIEVTQSMPSLRNVGDSKVKWSDSIRKSFYVKSF